MVGSHNELGICSKETDLSPGFRDTLQVESPQGEETNSIHAKNLMSQIRDFLVHWDHLDVLPLVKNPRNKGIEPK